MPVAQLRPVEQTSMPDVEGLTVYDAAYVDLALREGIPLATLDQEMRAAATRLGITIFDPLGS